MAPNVFWKRLPGQHCFNNHKHKTICSTLHFHNDVLLLVSLGNCPCGWACFTPKMVQFPSGVRLYDLTLSWLNRTPGVCQLSYGSSIAASPGDKNNDSHQTTTSSPALQTKIWASSWAGKKGQPSQSKSPSSQVEISLVSLPENMTAHTYTSIFKYINIIRYHGIKSLSASLVCAACGNEGLEAGHVDAVAYAARDLHRS